MAVPHAGELSGAHAVRKALAGIDAWIRQPDVS